MNWEFLIQNKESLLVSTDTRNLPAGCVFFALHGANFDGNKFAQQALEQGASLVVIDDPEVFSTLNPQLSYTSSASDRSSKGEIRTFNSQHSYTSSASDRSSKGEIRTLPSQLLLVEDTLLALQDLARAWRRHLGLPIIGVTGTNGKTTTKELLATVLSTKYNLHYTQGNLNNQIGVPLTLLSLTTAHELAIVEMGASHPGDIKELVDIAEPNYGLITNVGRAHLEGFGSFEGVQRTKQELYDYLVAHQGTIFRNTDNPYLAAMHSNAAREFRSLGVQEFRSTSEPLNRAASELSEPLNRAASELSEPLNSKASEPSEPLNSDFVAYTTGVMPDGTRLVGAYNAENISAALCVGEYFGVDREQGLAAIRQYVPTNNRSQAMTTERNRLIVDAYNANPTSMQAAISVFKGDTFILGAMRELGEYTHLEHQNVVNMLAERKADLVFLVGEEYRLTTSPYPIFDTVDQLHAYLEEHPLTDKHILLKGSRSTHIEQLLDIL
ncbi:MAG: UDP-N-acetylmuramoyl-tripeptide--D-alanyl-D-alanine ligase [Paludibacteraceae bacterium]|nr:UDP-N-acetylmuramoyl-tripeptide--D-alanyl-D-alanine ligase [Paludibacteraceae bacterium]